MRCRRSTTKYNYYADRRNFLALFLPLYFLVPHLHAGRGRAKFPFWNPQNGLTQKSTVSRPSSRHNVPFLAAILRSAPPLSACHEAFSRIVRSWTSRSSDRWHLCREPFLRRCLCFTAGRFAPWSSCPSNDSHGEHVSQWCACCMSALPLYAGCVRKADHAQVKDVWSQAGR